MNVSRTAALLLLATLIVGIALGALGAGALRPRLERPAPPPPLPGGRPGGGFAEHMMRVIEPTDSVQAANVRAVVERTATRNRGIIEELNGTLKASVDSMRAELAPMLTADQRDRLQQAASQLPPVRGPGAPGDRGPDRRGPDDRGGAPPEGPPRGPPPG